MDTSSGMTFAMMMIPSDSTVNCLLKPICWHIHFLCLLMMSKLLCLYTAHLWRSYNKATFKKLQVAYNEAIRILLKLPRWTSGSQLFVHSGVPTLDAVLRNRMYKFMVRLKNFSNEIMMALTMPYHAVLSLLFFFLFGPV